MRWALLLVTLMFCTHSFARIYITVSGAKVKKGRLAVGKIHALTTRSPRVEEELASQIKLDLQLMNLFSFVEPERYSNLDTKANFRKMRYAEWGLTGASFVLKLGYEMSGKKLRLEALMYDVAGEKKIFGTRYEYAASSSYKLVHTLAEDIMKSLTGESGLFDSRILMVCHGRKRRGQLTKEIFISDSDGRNFRAITFDRRLSLSPSWAPNGRTITYTQYQLRPVRGTKSLASKGKKGRANQTDHSGFEKT